MSLAWGLVGITEMIYRGYTSNYTYLTKSTCIDVRKSLSANEKLQGISGVAAIAMLSMPHSSLPFRIWK